MKLMKLLFAKFNNFSKIRQPAEIHVTLWSSKQATNTQSFYPSACLIDINWRSVKTLLFQPVI